MTGVSVAYCSDGNLRFEFAECLDRMMNHDLTHGGHLAARHTLACGPRIAAARNQLTKMMLEHPAKPDWLLMIDSDMCFPHDLVDRLLEVADPIDVPILGGLCFGGHPDGVVFPTIYRLRTENEDGQIMETVHDYPPNELVVCDATGAACLLVHRDVLETMEKRLPPGHPMPWFAESVHMPAGAKKGIEFGEDWHFCMQARAAGFPIHVHTGIELTHVKPCFMGSRHHKRYLELKAQVGDDGVRTIMKAQAFQAVR